MQYPITNANTQAVKYAPPPDQAAQQAARHYKKRVEIQQNRVYIMLSDFVTITKK